MKILHVFNSFATGGQQRRLALLANRLPALEHKIVALDGDYGATALFGSDVLWSRRDVVVTKRHLFVLNNIRYLQSLIRSANPDLLCTYNWGTIEVALANRLFPSGKKIVPQIHFEDGFGPDETTDSQKWQRVLARRWLLRDRHVVVPSRGLQAVTEKKWRLSKGDVSFIPNGVDIAAFKRSERDPGRRVVIGSVGALRQEKNISRLIRLFFDCALKDQARLIIAGDGPDRQSLEAQVANLDLQADITFTGHTDNPAEIYHQLDIFALTSSTEQMPFGVLEAMACGLPIIATDVGDVASMVSDKNRPFVVPVADETGLRSELIRLVHNKVMREHTGAANREKAERDYSLDHMVDSYDTLFNKIAGITSSPEKR